METILITKDNIEKYRGDITINYGDLPYGMWQVFEQASFDANEKCQIAPIDNIVSTKNQLLDLKFLSGEKDDPRQTAFNRMLDAANGLIEKRGPVEVNIQDDGKLCVVDGNATVQVLMLAGWKQIPVLPLN